MKIFYILTLLITQQLFALISIAPIEIGENVGLNGSISASLQTKRGSTNKENYSAGTKLSYDNNSSFVTWMELSAEYGESNKVKDTNKQFTHIRHIYALTDELLRAELFAQIQADEFKLINNRTLNGIGLRYKLFKIFDNAQGYLGLGGFYEHITYTSADPIESNMRLNNYFAFSINFAKRSSLAYTFYYQPIITDFSDFVTMHDFQLKLHIYRKLFLNFQLSYDLDTNPPIGVYRDNFTQTTAFLFEF